PQASDRVAVVLVHPHQKLRQISHFDASEILRLGFCQDVTRFEIRSGIPDSETTGNRKSKDLPGALVRAFSNVSSVAPLDGKHHFPNVCGRHGVDKFVTERWKHIRL